MNLDDELKSALRRVDPPAGFAGRVMARAVDSDGDSAGNLRPARESLWRWLNLAGWPGVRRAAAAAMLLVLVWGGVYYRQRQERIAGERAKEQLVMALRIAGAKLHLAQVKVRRFESGHRGEL